MGDVTSCSLVRGHARSHHRPRDLQTLKIIPYDLNLWLTITLARLELSD